MISSSRAMLSTLCLLFVGASTSRLYGQSFTQVKDGLIGQNAAVPVSESISMTQLADPSYLGGAAPGHVKVGQFSPDRTHFVILVKKGNLRRNTVDYTLLLFKTDDVLHSPKSQTLVSFSSSSNRPGIQDVRWLNDSTLTFLGENPGEFQQLYMLDCTTRQVRRVTNHRSSLTWYVVRPEDNKILFVAERPKERLFGETGNGNDFVVEGQNLADLILGESSFSSGFSQDLFAVAKENVNDYMLVSGVISTPSPALSPDGRYLVLVHRVSEIPLDWHDYKDKNLQVALATNYPTVGNRLVYQYQLIDLSSGITVPLLNSPVAKGYHDILWSPDSRSVAVTGTFLPLDDSDGGQRTARQYKSFAVQVTVPDRKIIPIAEGDLHLRRWDASNEIFAETATGDITVDRMGQNLKFQKTSEGWLRVPNSDDGKRDDSSRELKLSEGMNTPPKIMVRSRDTAQESLLLDLNPQFANIDFAKVNEISFEASDGHNVKAGLYWPPSYFAGQKRPLVIQTHGWNPERFWIDGPYSTAFAAQTFAGQGLFVVQLPEDGMFASTPKEAQREMAAYEGAIDYLDNRGLIDRTHVGIIGFSRTGFFVKYALTHSKYQFAAAVIADASDQGYFQYLSILNSFPGAAADAEGTNGGVPFGPGLASWVENSPGFGLDKIVTPIRLEAHGPNSLFYAWEWFVGLLRLKKPVDLVYLPDGDHDLVRPWERMTSQGGAVDWLDFWLIGQEDLSPSKAKQYARWREMRKLQEQNQSDAPTN
jgi:dipeptidyl aminopeptidase/acylaminoacyl peptidase